MAALKVCIFTETYHPVVGGGETQAQLLAEGLIARGHSVIILTRRSDKNLKKFERIGPIPVYRLLPYGIGQCKKWGLIFTGFPKLIRLRKQYDVIFVSGFRIIGLTAVLLSKLLGKRCILKADSRGEMSGEFFKKGLKRQGLSPTFLPFRVFLKLRNFILKKSDAFSAIAEEIASEFISANIPARKIYHIPNSVDTHRFYPVSVEQKSVLRKKLDLPATSRIVIYTGRLVSYKGLPLLLRVWQEIQKQHRDARLLLLGSGGLDIHNCEAELRTFVRSNGLAESVCFTGNVQNVSEYLQASDIFSFPTESDAFPSSLVEAMSCGLPVVTTPVGAIKTIVTDKENGVLIPPGDFQQLHRALDTLIRDSELAARLGQAAWKKVQDHYSAETVTRQYLTLFQKAIAAA